MSFQIEGNALKWYRENHEPVVLFEEGSVNWPVLCGFRAVNINDVSAMVFQKDFSCKAETWFKYYLLFAMFQDNPDDAETCAYIRKNFPKIFAYCIENQKLSVLKELIDSGKFITNRNIEKWIQYTIDNQEHEVYLMLLNYKNQVLGYQDRSKKFRL